MAQTPAEVVAFVDRHLPNELFFSLAARVRSENVLLDPRSTLGRLFGARSMIPSADLPAHLQEAFQRFARYAGFRTVEDLIDRATLYPYYRMFMSSDRWADVLARARGDDAGGLKTRLGLVAQRFGASPRLRSCRQCSSDAMRLGGPYWHTFHQLPGVQVCAIHGIALGALSQQSRSSNRHELVMAQDNLEPQKIPVRWIPALHAFARLSRSALDCGSKPPEPAVRRASYLAALRDKGFVRGKHHIRWPRLLQAINTRFLQLEPFEFGPRLATEGAGPPGWLRSVLSERDRQSHPICHLLLIGVLFGSVDSFMSACKAAPKADGESHSGAHGAAQGQRHLSESAEMKLLRDANRSCRNVAAELKISVSTVVKRRRALGMPIAERRKSMMPERLAAIRAALVAGADIGTVAQTHEVSQVSVYRILASSPKAVELRKRAIKMAVAKSHREDWEQARKRWPRASVAVLRSRVGAAYAWLRKHEPGWLDAHLPKNQERKVPLVRVDWKSRDRELTSKVADAAQRLRAEDHPKCLTPSRIASLICPESSWRRNADKLPAFGAALSRHSETYLQFKQRVGRR